jgi:hypothetical protein
MEFAGPCDTVKLQAKADNSYWTKLKLEVESYEDRQKLCGQGEEC